jgi:carbon-monoxide dehydrogenase medium subunit
VKKESGKIASAHIGVTGLANKSFRAAAAEKALVGTAGSAADIQKAAGLVAENVDANSDLHASADYRKHLAKVYAARALTAALG